MVKVIHTERKSAVLTPSSLACLSRIPTINLTAGCAHGCVYCYTRGYRSHPGDGRVALYANTLEKLRDELARRRRKPTAVYFSPASDLFQPVDEVLDLAYELLDLLLGRGIGVAILTKGTIPERHMNRLVKDAANVRVQMGMITLDPTISGLFEPRAARPEVRLAQLRRLVDAGVAAQVRLDPIIPAVTDDEASLEHLLSEVAAAGVKDIAVSTLFLRPAVKGALCRGLPDEQVARRIFKAYERSGRMAIHASNSTVVALPKPYRRRIYDSITNLAEGLGLKVRICTCKNPDMSSQSCGIAGEWSSGPSAAVQLDLFSDEGRK